MTLLISGVIAALWTNVVAVERPQCAQSLDPIVDSVWVPVGVPTAPLSAPLDATDTVSVAGALRVSAPLVPVMASDAVPVAVAAVVVIVRVDEPAPPVMVAGTNDAEAPAGSPVTLSATSPVKPSTGVAATEKVVEVPAAMLRDAGVADTAKSGRCTISVIVAVRAMVPLTPVTVSCGDPAGVAADVPGYISWPFAVAIVYTIATFGSIGGGWLPKKFITGGMDPSKARKLAMFIFALFPLSVLAASRLGEINIWFAVLTIALACSAHQAWSANIFTTVSDMFPKRAVASVTGIGGMAGGIGGILIARAAGKLLAHYTAIGKIEVGYGILFVICGTAYLVAWVVMHLLVPKFKLVQLD